MKKKYKARKGSRFKDKEAQVIGNHLESLQDDKGHITTKQIVESAKPKDSSIHSYFEWHNGKAADEYRLQQARLLTESVVEIVVIENKEIQQRSFFSVRVKNVGRVYVTIKTAMETEDYRKQLLNKAIVMLENLTVTMKMFRDSEKKS